MPLTEQIVDSLDLKRTDCIKLTLKDDNVGEYLFYANHDKKVIITYRKMAPNSLKTEGWNETQYGDIEKIEKYVPSTN